MWGSLCLMKPDFFVHLTKQFDKSINLFQLVFLTLQFFVCSIFLTTDTVGFHCFFNQAIFFFTISFIAFDFIIFDLNSNPNSLVEIVFTTTFFVDCLICLNVSGSSKNIKVFIVMINSKDPHLVLNLCPDVVLQSIILLIANFSAIKILLHCFLVRVLFHIYVFYDFE